MRTERIGMRTCRNPYVLLRYVQYTLAEILEYDFSAKMNNKKLVAGGGRYSDRLTCRGQGTGRLTCRENTRVSRRILIDCCIARRKKKCPQGPSFSAHYAPQRCQSTSSI